MFVITMEGRGKNALGTDMMTWLLAKLDEAKGQPVLFTGTGDAFSAGLDLKEVGALDDAGMEKFLRLLERVMTAVFLYPAPTVAVVNGHAIAGGCVLTLCCDHRVAVKAPKAKIGLNEVALGLRFPPQVLGIVRHRIPPEHLEEVVLGAGLYDPEGALRVGMVDELSDDARAAGEKALARLAGYPKAAYAAAKMDVRGDAVKLTEAIEQRFVREVLPMWTTPELKERIKAALAR